MIGTSRRYHVEPNGGMWWVMDRTGRDAAWDYDTEDDARRVCEQWNDHEWRNARHESEEQ